MAKTLVAPDMGYIRLPIRWGGEKLKRWKPDGTKGLRQTSCRTSARWGVGVMECWKTQYSTTPALRFGVKNCLYLFRQSIFHHQQIDRSN
jgi:hypothetical protein